MASGSVQDIFLTSLFFVPRFLVAISSSFSYSGVKVTGDRDCSGSASVRHKVAWFNRMTQRILAPCPIVYPGDPFSLESTTNMSPFLKRAAIASSYILFFLLGRAECSVCADCGRDKCAISIPL